ncbi:M56 family metallopeptidase [Streptomyces sp. NBC_00316]|uniref:M56 family metallopeptidase n=1 Tax=Streptomyces sp. NBC_00316 TaxID=2975710 RepID=UPI002E28F963|nr:M56 family metallopeptidase [Streptomyces sp. NBC_00316]
MHLAIYLPLLFPLLAGPAARPLADRLEPRLATWVLTTASVVLAAGSTTVLGLLALAGLVHIPRVAELADLSPAVLGRDDPAWVSVAWFAAAALLAVAVVASRFLVRRVRAVCAAVLASACFPGQDPLVVMEEPAADAFAMPGLPGRIVVSTGMLATLDDTERAILFAHERSHLRAHHYLFAAAAQLAAAANPLVRPLAAQVSYTVERWADEDAADATGDRRRVAVTVGKAALATKRSGGLRRLSSTALGILGRRGGERVRLDGAGPVPRRVAALLAPVPAGGKWRAAATAAYLAAAVLCTVEAAQDLHEVLERARGG